MALHQIVPPSSSVVLSGHKASVGRVRFSPDGRTAVTCGYDARAMTWDVASGRLLHVFKGHKDTVTSAAFSPDRSCLVTASFDSTVQMWDTRSGGRVGFLKGHKRGVLDVRFSADGHHVVTGAGDGRARLFDVGTMELVRIFNHLDGSGSYFVDSVDISPDGERLLAVLGYGKSAVWDVRSGTKLCTIDDRGCVGRGAAFTPDGMFIVLAEVHNDSMMGVALGDLVAWNARTGVPAWRLKGAVFCPGGFAFFPRSRLLATGESSRHLARIWSMPSTEPVMTPEPVMVLEGHAGNVLDVAVSPDEACVATASSDKTARLWKLCGSAADYRAAVPLGEDDMAL
jgi:WD40 repeat protein